METSCLGGLLGQEELPWALTSLLGREVLPCLLSLISSKRGCEPVPRPAAQAEVARWDTSTDLDGVFSANTSGKLCFSLSQKQRN